MSGMNDANLERRNRLVLVYSDLVPPIAHQVARQTGFGAEDLEQSGHIGLLNAATAFGAYVRVKIRGAMLDSINARDRVEARHERIYAIADPVGTEAGPDQFVLAGEIHAAIGSELTGRQQQVVILELQGYSGVEIAARPGIRHQSVGALQRRAKAALQLKLCA